MTLNKKQAETIIQALNYWAREIETDPDFESSLTEAEVYSLAESFEVIPSCELVLAKFEKAWPHLGKSEGGTSAARR